VQLYGLDPAGFRAILAAVRAEFPSVYVFSWERAYGDVLLLAAAEPLRPEDLPRWERLPAPVRDDLQGLRHYSSPDLWSLVRLVPEDVDRLVGDAPVVNSDENLFVELSSPRLLQSETRTLEMNWALFRPFGHGVLPLLRALGEPLDADRIGALALSYIQGRRDTDVATALARESLARGRSAHGIAASVALAAGSSRDSLLAQLDEAVSLAPDAVEPRVLRAIQLMTAGHDFEGLADLEAAIALAPDDPRPPALRWQALHRLGRLPEAVAQLDAFVRTPSMRASPALWRSAAEVYLAAGRLEDGIVWLRRVVHGQPLRVESWELLAAACDRTGRAEEAERARRNAGRARQNQVLVAQRDARLAAARGDWKQAVDIAQQALSKQPGYEPLVRDLARFRAGR
jgi:tetratricopeptide (TPR) repeat protein